MAFIDEMKEKCGWDYEETKVRFMGSEKMINKFFQKFIDDHSYENLVRSFAEGDREQITHYAHSLKGVAVNMGLTFLGAAAYELQLAGETEGAELDGLYAKVTAEYTKAVPMIKEYLASL